MVAVIRNSDLQDTIGFKEWRVCYGCYDWHCENRCKIG